MNGVCNPFGGHYRGCGSGVSNVPGPGVAGGGSIGQVLVKRSGSDFDTIWTDFPTSFEGDVFTAVNYYTRTEVDTLLAGFVTTVSWNDITDKPILFDGTWSSLTGKPTLFSGSWNDLTDRPVLFSGAYADLTGLPTLFDGTWASLTGKPAEFTPSAHTHAIGDTTGLQAALDAKMDDSQFVVLTYAEYEALATKDPNTFYFIPEA